MDSRLNDTLLASELFITDSFYVRSFVSDTNRPVCITFHFAADIPTVEEVYNGAAPFGFNVLKSMGFNVISVSPVNVNNWYRDNCLFDYLQKLSVDLNIFPEVIGYGSSMGGFAVSAFSDLLNITRMLLLNPISTLNRDIVPWESRFRNSANSLTWDGDYHDGAKISKPGFLIYDPTHVGDSKHAGRYKGIEKIRAYGAGHNVPRLMLDLRMLKECVVQFYNNELTRSFLVHELKKSRALACYSDALMSQKHLTSWRKIVISYHRAMNRSYDKAGVFAYVYDAQIEGLCSEIDGLIKEGRLNLALNLVNFAISSTSSDPRLIALKEKIFYIHQHKVKK